MPLELVDTHCHLDLDPLGGMVEQVLARAQAAGVRHCVSIGTTLEASRTNVQVARQHPMVRAAVGVHPNHADSATEDILDQLETLAVAPEVVAIGEVGLDCYRHAVSLARQQDALRAFVAIAQRKHLPLLIHCRDAYEPLLALLRSCARAPLAGVIHCASGPPEFIQGALEFGLHISFAGNVTFPNAQALRSLVPLVPDERLLIETDAPFLAPQPVRGTTNEPAYVAHTAAAVAQLRGVTTEALGAITTRNARRLFKLSEPGTS